jgi:hypothetical protein
MRLSLIWVFFSLLVLSVVVAILFFARKHAKFVFLAAILFALALLGGALILLTLEQDVGGSLRIFLILAGVAPAAMIASIILHNAISGLLTSLLNRDFEEAVFFLIALFGCPAVFLVGVVGSLVLIIRDIILK